MRQKLLILGTFAGLAITVPTCPAANSGSPTTPASGGARGTVVCSGAQNVPVTADAEQALPMHVVAQLSCGDEVAVVSDSQGYTVKILTADGKSGYVARMYLSESPAPSLKDPRPVEAAADKGIARWELGAPGTDHFRNGGSMVESLTANGITVQVSLQDSGWKLRASVAIVNDSAEQVHFNPSDFTLDELTPRLRALRYQHPEDLAKSQTHQVFWTQASAIAPASAVYTTTANETRRVIIAVPNYLAQQARPDQASVLSEGSVRPNEKTSGVVWFERDKNPQELNLRIFVADQIFEFPLSFPQHN
jgi:hypothetical protein